MRAFGTNWARMQLHTDAFFARGGMFIIELPERSDILRILETIYRNSTCENAIMRCTRSVGRNKLYVYDVRRRTLRNLVAFHIVRNVS